MKVWEKIIQDHNDCKNMNRDTLRAEMYMHRYLACEANHKYKYVSQEELERNCLNCDECLDQFLDMEVTK